MHILRIKDPRIWHRKIFRTKKSSIQGLRILDPAGKSHYIHSFLVVHSQCQWSSGSPWPSSKARLFSSCRLAGPSKSRLTLRRESRREATGGTPLGSYVYKHSVFIQFSLSVISYFLHLIRFGKAVAPVSSSLRKMHLEKRQKDFPSEITSAH